MPVNAARRPQPTGWSAGRPTSGNRRGGFDDCPGHLLTPRGGRAGSRPASPRRPAAISPVVKSPAGPSPTRAAPLRGSSKRVRRGGIPLHVPHFQGCRLMRADRRSACNNPRRAACHARVFLCRHRSAGATASRAGGSSVYLPWLTAVSAVLPFAHAVLPRGRGYRGGRAAGRPRGGSQHFRRLVVTLAQARLLARRLTFSRSFPRRSPCFGPGNA